MMTNKNALIIVQNLSIPTDRRVWREGLYLKKHGFSVFIISPTGKKDDRKYYEDLEGIKIIRFPLISDIGGKYYYFVEYLWSFIAIFFLFLCICPTVQYVQVCNPPDIFFPIGWICRLFNKKFIYDHHDSSPILYLHKYGIEDRNGILYKLLHLCEGFTVQIANSIISTNQVLKEILESEHTVNVDKIYISRNLPDPETFKRVEPNPVLKHGKEHLMTYHGIMGEVDDVEIIVLATNELIKQQINNFHVTIIGDGQTKKQCEELVYKLNLQDYIDFTGMLPTNKLIKYLSTASIGLMPDKKNLLNDISSKNKTVEYMSLGLPFVAFDLKETMDTAWNAALYATNNNYKDFAEKIATLLKNQALRESLKYNAVERMKHYRYEDQMGNYLKAFK